MPKPKFIKKIERKFFSIFNEKTSRRRAIGKAVILLPLLPIYLPSDRPDDDRTANGAAQVQKLQSEIGQLTKDSHSIAFNGNGKPATGQDAAIIKADQQAVDLTARLVLETGISEEDAQALATQFLENMKDPVFSGYVVEAMKAIAEDADYLRDARQKLAGNPEYAQLANRGEKAMAVIKTMQDGEPVTSKLFDILIAIVFVNFVFDGAAMMILRRGSRRDDKLKQEERTETVQDTATQLKDLLKPKDGPKP